MRLRFVAGGPAPAPLEPWPLQPDPARREAEDAARRRKAAAGEAAAERREREREHVAKGLDAAVAWELERIAQDGWEPPRAPPPADGGPQLGMRVVREDGRKLLSVSFVAQSKQGDGVAVEFRKRLDDGNGSA